MNYPPTTNADASRTLVEWLAAQPTGLRADVVADAASDAAIVGLGVSTREAHEVFRLVEESTHVLLDQGFSTVAVLDNPRVVDLYDRYVSGHEVDLDHALAQAWGPWQTTEMRQALTRLRETNQGRPTAPVRIIGIGSSELLPTDYDRITDLLTAVDPGAAARVKDQLDVVRVAHDSGEHVLRAQGTHPGTPFVDLARDARQVVVQLEASAERDAALELLDTVVEFHAHAVGAGYDMAEEERAAAQRLLDHHRRTGERVVLWEGSAHIAAHSAPMLGSPLGTDLGDNRMLGAHLKAALGDRYTAVHITFGHGSIERADIPAPRPDSIEAQFTDAEGDRTVRLRDRPPAGLASRFERSWLIRLISGVYDPAEDAENYIELLSLTDSFDVLIYTPTITPTGALANA